MATTSQKTNVSAELASKLFEGLDENAAWIKAGLISVAVEKELSADKADNGDDDERGFFDVAESLDSLLKIYASMFQKALICREKDHGDEDAVLIVEKLLGVKAAMDRPFLELDGLAEETLEAAMKEQARLAELTSKELAVWEELTNIGQACSAALAKISDQGDEVKGAVVATKHSLESELFPFDKEQMMDSIREATRDLQKKIAEADDQLVKYKQIMKNHPDFKDIVKHIRQRELEIMALDSRFDDEGSDQDDPL